ncbi:MAG: outer membrane lipid asymmetry maintenance protein MlaD [Algiphilus sp.]|nr:outer membrane lipid asymmetry maintenance protein MlaD [Algiphilus sp.]MCI5063168.1 outer membrane lipid asymmetry maintenance protein MlaD [Algiphilus sp.]MCI5104585.1 outer membrane lipid asymmetry maintenance protein MlaD [Algiphilus sp.]MCR9091868.1 outer membrane lipid asymmetry maintenance protein MlaD [Pseudomonadota bacterium]
MVGLFFVLGVAAVFLLTFRVAGLDSGGPEEGYTVTADFNNIGGLRSGSAVTLSGVRIGRVSNIAIDDTTFAARVTMKIHAEYDNLPADSGASILTSGLLGEQYIGINPGGAMESLQDGDRLPLTQDALVLENLVGRVLESMTQ